MRDTKARILEAALQQFNAHGFTNVSIRDISKSIHMQAGNLAYHFKNTGVLLEKLYDRMYAEMEGVIHPQGFPDMQHFDLLLRHFYDFQYRYRFFFLDLIEITRKYPEVAARHRDTVNKRITEGTALLYYYAGAGLIRAEVYADQFSSLSRMIWMTNTFWLAQQRLLHPNHQDDPSLPQRWVWELIWPYLTQAGLRASEQVIPGLALSSPPKDIH
jgi:AcrR family transcriptional regulator